MTVEQLYDGLSDMVPGSLSCDWDNDGIMVLPSAGQRVSKVLVALDADEYSCSYALENEFDVIVTHHPIIFRPLKKVSDVKLTSLIKNNISVFSFHTRLDAYVNGVNRALADKLLIADLQPLENGIGMIGRNRETMTVNEYAECVSKLLGTAVSYIPSEKEVKSVAVVGGSGGDFVENAISAGADVLVTGEAGYHVICDASEIGLHIFVCGHYETEFPVCAVLRNMIIALDDSLTVEIFHHRKIFVKKSKNLFDNVDNIAFEF